MLHSRRGERQAEPQCRMRCYCYGHISCQDGARHPVSGLQPVLASEEEEPSLEKLSLLRPYLFFSAPERRPPPPVTNQPRETGGQPTDEWIEIELLRLKPPLRPRQSFPPQPTFINQSPQQEQIQHSASLLDLMRRISVRFSTLLYQ